MKKILILILVLIVMALLFIPRYLAQSAHDRKIAALSQKSDTATVRVMKMKPKTQPIEITLPSYLDAINVTPIWARTNGYLHSFEVDIGDEVSAGQLLAVIDTPDVDAEVARAEGELASMVAKAEINEITAQRWTSLYEYNPESLSREEVDVKVADFDAATADVAAAQGNLDYWKTIQSFKYVYAPFDGIITSRSVDIGSLIRAGGENSPDEFFMMPQKQELFQIANTGTLRAFVDVPQSLFYLVQDGLKAEATIWQYPSKAFEGKIVRNSGALDPKARTLLTQVNLNNETQELKPGLYAEVKFKFLPKEKAYMIPVGALIVRNGPPYVAVVRKNTVHLQQVKIGVDGGRALQIIDGIQPNDLLIVSPTDRTIEGTTVNPIVISEEDENALIGTPAPVQGNEAIMG